MGLKLDGANSKIESIGRTTTTETIATQEQHYSNHSSNGFISAYKATVTVTATFNSSDEVQITYVSGVHLQEKTLTTTIGALKSNTKLDGSYLSTGYCSLSSCSFTGSFKSTGHELIYSSLVVRVTRTTVITTENDIILEDDTKINGNLTCDGLVCASANKLINLLNSDSLSQSEIGEILLLEDGTKFNTQRKNVLQTDQGFYYCKELKRNRFYMITCREVDPSKSDYVLGGLFFWPSKVNFPTYAGVNIPIVNESKTDDLARVILGPYHSGESRWSSGDWSTAKGVWIGVTSQRNDAFDYVTEPFVHELPLQIDLNISTFFD